MKKIINKIIFIIALLPLLAGCEEDKEIDLSVVSRGIRDFFQNLNTAIFKAIQFVIKNIIILFILIFLQFYHKLFLKQNAKAKYYQVI